MALATSWASRGNTVLWERNQTQKVTRGVLAFRWNIQTGDIQETDEIGRREGLGGG